MSDAIPAGHPVVDPGQANAQPSPDAAQQTVKDTPATQPQSWLDSLPDDLKGNETLKGFGKAEDMVKDYLALKDQAGKAPKAPDKASDYKINLPEGMERNEVAEQRFRDAAHKLGLTQAQVDGILEVEVAAGKDAIEAHAKAMEDLKGKTEKDLKKEWGANYDVNMKLYLRAYDALANDKIKAFVTKSGLEHDAEFVKLFQNIGSMISEDKLVPPGDRNPDNVRRMPDGTRMLDFNKTP